MTPQLIYALKEIKIEVTYDCPLKCIHCSSEATPGSLIRMTIGECSSILRQAAALKVQEIAFSGGEPLAWSPIIEVVSLASRLGLHCSLYTSGNVDNLENKLKALKRAGLRKLAFSLFGASKVIHENITRVPDSFEKTINAISVSQKLQFPAEIHFVPFSSNYAELPGLVSSVQKMGIARVSVLRFVPQGRGKLVEQAVLSPAQNKELRKSILRLRELSHDIRTGSPYNFLLLKDQPQCFAAKDRITINPELKIYPCDAFKQVEAKAVVGTSEFSTLKEFSLEDCWKNSPFLKIIRDYLASPFEEPCLSCKSLKKCHSGCLAQKFIRHGDFTKRADPDCIII